MPLIMPTRSRAAVDAAAAAACPASLAAWAADWEALRAVARCASLAAWAVARVVSRAAAAAADRALFAAAVTPATKFLVSALSWMVTVWAVFELPPRERDPPVRAMLILLRFFFC